MGDKNNHAHGGVNHGWQIIQNIVKEKCVSLESFNIAKCKMLKHRKNEWDNPHKHHFIRKKGEKSDLYIFFNIPNLNWLKDYIKYLGHGTHPDSHYQQTYLFPSLPPKFSCFPAEKAQHSYINKYKKWKQWVQLI